jgi:hypothetical protein
MFFKKYLNKFLNKKSDFTEDEKLKTLNDQFYFILGEERKLLNFLIKENIKYYFTHKKIYLTKLLFVNTIRVGAIAGIIFGIFFTLNYFNILDISKSKPKIADKITIYLPDYDTVNQKKLEKDFNVVIIFLPDSRKDWKLYKKAVHNIETHGTTDAQSYLTQSPDKLYWGRYQLGAAARKISKAGQYTWSEFSSNPDAQEAAFLEWAKFLKKSMQPEINRYSGQFISGVQMTESGIISIAHNAGDGAAKLYLRNGKIPDNVIKFAKLGGYNLNLE